MKHIILIIGLIAIAISGCIKSTQEHIDDIHTKRQTNDRSIPRNCSGNIYTTISNQSLQAELHDAIMINNNAIRHQRTINAKDNTIQEPLELTGEATQYRSGDKITTSFSITEQQSGRAKIIAETINQVKRETPTAVLQNTFNQQQIYKKHQRILTNNKVQITPNTQAQWNPKTKTLSRTGNQQVRHTTKKQTEIIRSNHMHNREIVQYHKSPKFQINFNKHIDQQDQLTIHSTIKKRKNNYHIQATIRIAPPPGDKFRNDHPLEGDIQGTMLCNQTI